MPKWKGIEAYQDARLISGDPSVVVNQSLEVACQAKERHEILNVLWLEPIHDRCDFVEVGFNAVWSDHGACK